MKTTQALVLILSFFIFFSCKKEKDHPRILSYGTTPGSYKELQKISFSTTPIFELDSVNTAKTHSVYSLHKVYGESASSIDLSERLTFSFQNTGSSFEYKDVGIVNTMCQVSRNDNQFYRISRGYLKGQKDANNKWTISFSISYSIDTKTSATTTFTSWE